MMDFNRKLKILVLGDSRVGKTTFVHALCHNQVINDPPWTLGCNIEIKEKLEIIVGGNYNEMKLQLLNEDKVFVKDLTDDQKTLNELGVFENCTVNVDVPNLIDFESNDAATYQLSREDYEKRNDSADKWMREKKLGKYKEISEEEKSEKERKRKEEEEKEQAHYNSINVGDQCEVQLPDKPPRTGIVRFKGVTKFKPGLWIGIEYYEPVGLNDGSVSGTSYFSCKPKYGGFVKPLCVKTGDYPEPSIDDFDEI